ncbi:unnamed protein product [Caretta caretta]
MNNKRSSEQDAKEFMYGAKLEKSAFLMVLHIFLKKERESKNTIWECQVYSKRSYLLANASWLEKSGRRAQEDNCGSNRGWSYGAAAAKR